MVDLVFNNLTSDKTRRAGFFKKIIEASSQVLKLTPKNIELSINLVRENKIRSFNQRYRKKNKTTDVLSFPLLSKIDKKSGISGIMPLGDIFICLPIAKKCAAKEGITLNSELAFLSVHGFLHLLGYDHEKSSDQKKMFTIQNKILKKLSV